MSEKKEGLIKGEEKREKEVLKILEEWLRRIFGFEKRRKKEDYFRSPEFDEVKVAGDLAGLKTDVNWIKRFLWFIMASLVLILKMLFDIIGKI
ncbi:MAG TPA: hypothetical protein C5S37_10825 [Methanophagales archaeon]|nr:hypothetical protein [Methanophagales archaeon]